MPTAAVSEIGDISGVTSSDPSQPNSPRKSITDPKYMHRPPRIVPNYGKKHRGLMPKSNVSRVLLYDNVTQQQMLDVKLTYLHTEQKKAGRLLDMHKKSFIVRRLQKQRQIAGVITHVDHDLPDLDILNLDHHDNYNGKAGVHSSERSHPAKHKDHDMGESNTNISSRKNSGRDGIREESVVKEGPEKDDEEDEGAEDGGERGRGDAEEIGTGMKEEEPKEVEEESELYSTTLPTLHQLERQGASASNGFVPHGHPTQHANKRGSQTAGAGIRESRSSQTLPDILDGTASGSASGSAERGKNGVLSMEEKNGVTRMLHTFQHNHHHQHHHQHFTGGVHGTHGHGNLRGRTRKIGVTEMSQPEGDLAVRTRRTKEDSRYVKLEKLLIKLDRPNEGYTELSPSFHSPRQTAHFSRPTSFRRRRSGRSRITSAASSVSSKASSYVSRPVSVKSRAPSAGGGAGADVSVTPIAISTS